MSRKAGGSLSDAAAAENGQRESARTRVPEYALYFGGRNQDVALIALARAAALPAPLPAVDGKNCTCRDSFDFVFISIFMCLFCESPHRVRGPLLY